MTLSPKDEPNLKLWTSPPSAKQIHELCTSWNYWSSPNLKRALEQPRYLFMCYGLETQIANKGEVQACLLAKIGPFTTDLIYLYIAQNHRRRGFGLMLLRQLWGIVAKTPEQEGLFLEVRANNRIAIKLYKSFGMVCLGQRSHYYLNGDHALVFHKNCKSRESRE